MLLYAKPAIGAPTEQYDTRPLPAPETVRAAIPSTGITVRDLINKLGVGNNLASDRRTRFFDMIKTVSVYDKAAKVLKPAPAPAPAP